jgi:hypothetical protein
MYHRIMSEQFIMGQQVYVQYGTNRSEDWFPAAIHLQNPDGTYTILYQDLDESDPTASKKHRPSESKLIAIATMTATTTTMTAMMTTRSTIDPLIKQKHPPTPVLV